MPKRIENHFAVRSLFEGLFKVKTCSELGMKVLPSGRLWVMLGENHGLYLSSK